MGLSFEIHFASSRYCRYSTSSVFDGNDLALNAISFVTLTGGSALHRPVRGVHHEHSLRAAAGSLPFAHVPPRAHAITCSSVVRIGQAGRSYAADG